MNKWTQTVCSLRIIWLIRNEQMDTDHLFIENNLTLLSMNKWTQTICSLRIIWLILNEQTDTDHLFIENNLTYSQWTNVCDTNICSLRIIWLILNEQTSDTNICSLRIIWLISSTKMDVSICSLRIIWLILNEQMDTTICSWEKSIWLLSWPNVWHKRLFIENNLTYLMNKWTQTSLLIIIWLHAHAVKWIHNKDRYWESIWLISWVKWIINNDRYVRIHLTHLMNKWTQTSILENKDDLSHEQMDTDICSLRIIWLIRNEQMFDTDICSLR